MEINIVSLFKNKNPKLLKVIPKFVFNYLKKIVHQDQINLFLKENEHKQGLDFINAVVEHFQIKITVIGKENIKNDGRYLFVSNHPLGGLDGVALIHEIGKLLPNPKFLVNDLLLFIKNFEGVFIPINKFGRNTTEHYRKITEAYESDAQMLTFPAGMVSRKQKGVISDLKWHKNFINQAKKHKRDVVPVYINGRNSNFFYNVALYRKYFGLGKVNIEMLYLVDEMYKQYGKEIKITIGTPISYNSFDNSKTPEQWASHLKEITYNLAR